MRWLWTCFFVLFPVALVWWSPDGLPGATSPAAAFEIDSPAHAAPASGGLKVQAFPDRNQVGAGGRFLVYVVVTLEAGWHIYSLEPQDDPTLPTRITLTANRFSPEGGWKESDPEIVEDKILNRMVKVHSGRAEFERPFAVPPGLEPGLYTLQGTFTYRACDNKVCTMPREIGFNTRIEVVPGDHA